MRSIVSAKTDWTSSQSAGRFNRGACPRQMPLGCVAEWRCGEDAKVPKRYKLCCPEEVSYNSNWGRFRGQWYDMTTPESFVEIYAEDPR